MFHVKHRERKLEYEAVVIGGGHAGCEAALSLARIGIQTLIITINIDKIALMPCNPSIGGIGKGQLVKELNALGGEMGRIADRACIQAKMLNASKGPAVRALRMQTDKKLYEDEMKAVLMNQENLSLLQGMVKTIMVERGKVEGLELLNGKAIKTEAVVLATGTFLDARVVVGEKSYPAGRVGEYAATQLSENLRKIGVELERLQTATPPRVDGRTLDYGRMVPQPGEKGLEGFSGLERPLLPQLDCHLTYTTEETHRVVRENLHKSPLKTGSVKGKGPRFCPSIERKIMNFPDKNRHPVFVEPEGWRTNEKYLQGLTTSMPPEAQQAILSATPGLEKARMMRPGYAVMYDFAPPQQLQPTLEHKGIRGLFFAGQINGTSGYEEAAAQGLMAGINAARWLRGEEGIVLARSEAYIGVMIDDLVTKGVEEPYRMFTSRAEFRLILRSDNADQRLKGLGHALGLVSDDGLEETRKIQGNVRKIIEGLSMSKVPRDGLEKILGKDIVNTGEGTFNALELLRRPEIAIQDLVEQLPDLRDYSSGELTAAETEIKYEGYIERQMRQAERLEELEKTTIPGGFDYAIVEEISYAAREQLRRILPRTLGQAARISTVTPADLSILSMYLKRSRR